MIDMLGRAGCLDETKPKQKNLITKTIGHNKLGTKLVRTGIQITNGDNEARNKTEWIYNRL
jgi:hypothetical protein